MKKSHKAFNKAKRKPTTENLVEFKKIRAKFRRIIKESKKQSWQTYISIITNKTPTNIWNKIRNINGITCNTEIRCLNLEDNYITNPQDIADVLAETFEKNVSTRVMSCGLVISLSSPMLRN